MEGLEVLNTADKHLALGHNGIEVVQGGRRHQAIDYNGPVHPFASNYDDGGTPAPLRYKQQEALPWNLRPLTFGLLVAAITFVAAGAIVGGVVGGVLTNTRKYSTNSVTNGPTSTITTLIYATTTSTTSTSATTSTTISATTSAPTSTTTPNTDYANYTAPLPSVIESVYFDCTDLSGSTLESSRGDTYKVFCGIDMPGNQGWTTSAGLQIVDFASMTVYSFEDCLSACSNANYLALPGQSKCMGVGFLSDMAFATTNYLANCWLKNGTTPDGTGNILADAIIGKLQ